MNDITKLKNDIEELERFTKQLESKQLNFPLDQNSINTVRLDLLVPTGNFIIPAGLASPYDESIEVNAGNKKFLLQTTEIRII